MCSAWNSALLAALAAGALAACDARPTGTAVAGARPTVEIPVGPLPGPEQFAPDAPNPYAGDRIALMEGRRLFVRMNCAGCHGGHAGGGMGPSLRDESWIYGSTDLAIFDSIAEGRAHGMPAWGMQLPREEVWKMVAYITSLRTPLEPEPPR
jgi:cytochrome c oxidase cbb3-type subunit 3